jgi:hypothetical protein
MENNVLVNKVDQLLNDKVFSSYTMQKTFSNLQPIVETKEVKKEATTLQPPVQPTKQEPVIQKEALPVETPKPAPKV